MRLFALALLLVLAAVGFGRRFAAVVRTVRASRKDADFRLRPLTPRIKRFVWEVLLQAKVIRERPWPGLAHALVFWGFCAFALATIDHLLRGLGLTVFSREGWYLRLVAVFAVAVAAAIAGLAARRFLARPKWLGPLSWESGLIALLIFVLMVTYLAAFRLGEHTTAGRLNWWVHTLALVVFLPLIPRTKHLHLVLSPLTVFLERPGFSRIPPLAGEEDFGLVAGRDLTWIDSLQAYTCVECGRCTEHCPAHNTGKLLDPKEIILGARRYLNEHGPASDTPLLGQHLAMEAAFQCTTCGACEFQCPVGIQHLPLIIGLRRGAVNTGRWEDDHGTRLFLNLERNGNPLGFPPAEREKFIQRHALPAFDGSQEFCLWLGCMGSYDPQGREIVLALVEVLRHLGVGFGVLRKEKCTGDAARRLGNDLLFEDLARANLDELRKSGVTRLLSICPHCVRTMRDDYRELGASLAVDHHSELLAGFSSRLPLRSGPREKVVFHDACYLGRYRGIYESPRRVIGRWGTVVDPPRARRRGFCCGAGGGLFFLGEEKGKRVGVERAEELLATGAEAAGTACPFCHSMLRDALATVSARPPLLLDIAQIAAATLKSGRG